MCLVQKLQLKSQHDVELCKSVTSDCSQSPLTHVSGSFSWYFWLKSGMNGWAGTSCCNIFGLDWKPGADFCTAECVFASIRDSILTVDDGEAQRPESGALWGRGAKPEVQGSWPRKPWVCRAWDEGDSGFSSSEREETPSRGREERLQASRLQEHRYLKWGYYGNWLCGASWSGRFSSMSLSSQPHTVWFIRSVSGRFQQSFTSLLVWFYVYEVMTS